MEDSRLGSASRAMVWTAFLGLMAANGPDYNQVRLNLYGRTGRSSTRSECDRSVSLPVSDRPDSNPTGCLDHGRGTERNFRGLSRRFDGAGGAGDGRVARHRPGDRACGWPPAERRSPAWPARSRACNRRSRPSAMPAGPPTDMPSTSPTRPTSSGSSTKSRRNSSGFMSWSTMPGSRATASCSAWRTAPGKRSSTRT